MNAAHQAVTRRLAIMASRQSNVFVSLDVEAEMFVDALAKDPAAIVALLERAGWKKVFPEGQDFYEVIERRPNGTAATRWVDAVIAYAQPKSD